MGYKKNKTKTNIEKDSDNKELLNIQDNNVTVTDILNQKSNIESEEEEQEEEDNTEKKEPSILKQFLIPKVYFIAISVYSLTALLLPVVIDYISHFFNFKFESKIGNKKKIGKVVHAINHHSWDNWVRVASKKKVIYDNVLIPMIYFCVIAPIVEEFIFRRLIFGIIKNYGQKLLKKDTSEGILTIVFAFIVSSILFSFGHFNMESDEISIEIIYYRTYFNLSFFVRGIIYAWIYYRYEYILSTILVQMFNNIAVIIFTLYMFSSGCYDHCFVHSLAFYLPYYGINLLVALILILYRSCKFIIHLSSSKRIKKFKKKDKKE